MKRAKSVQKEAASQKFTKGNDSTKLSVEKIDTVTVTSANIWKKWLDKNHLKKEKVNFISYKKHTNKGFITHRESLNIAICYGWIDTIVRKIDDDCFERRFVKRGDNATWSTNTLSYAKELYEAGEMKEFGIQRYQEGLKKLPLDHGIDKKPEMPEALKEALEKDTIARDNFNNFSNSKKYSHFRWILSAKRDDTKKNRIDKIVEAAHDNEYAY